MQPQPLLKPIKCRGQYPQVNHCGDGTWATKQTEVIGQASRESWIFRAAAEASKENSAAMRSM